jgi:hypothetical protein
LPAARVLFQLLERGGTGTVLQSAFVNHGGKEPYSAIGFTIDDRDKKRNQEEAQHASKKQKRDSTETVADSSTDFWKSEGKPFPNLRG